MDKLKAILAASLLLASPAMADPLRVRLDFGGALAWSESDSLAASLGFDSRQTAGAKLRLIWQGSSGPWSFEMQSLLSYAAGDEVGLAQAMAAILPPAPPASLSDLTAGISNGPFHGAALTLDRISVGYSQQNFVLKLGRQAVTWGSGMVFHPSDIIAPFSPAAVDTAYKPGVEMLYGQYLFDNGNDLEAVFVPRAATPGGKLDFGQSTLALRSTLLLGDLDGTVLLAKDRGDTLLNLALGGPMGGAAWNIEIGQWFLSGGGTATNFLANISNSGQLGDMNVTYFAEYFRNGFGVAGPAPLNTLPAPLASRIATGQLFNIGQDFLAIGGQLQVSAEVAVRPAVIASLNDGSALASLQISVSASDNLDINLSASKGFGKNGSEFGGRETLGGSGVFAAPPTQVRLQVTRYF